MTNRYGRRALGGLLAVAASLVGAPTAAAHGGSHAPEIPQWVALVPLLSGLLALGGVVWLARGSWRRAPGRVLPTAFVALALTAVGAVGVVQLSSLESLAGGSPVDRDWYRPLALAAGVLLAVGGLAVGRLRWPRRPRYAGFAILLGVWVAYPALFPGGALTNPLGYLVAFALPVALGYLLYRDARPLLRAVAADRHARRFGTAVGGLGALFFAFSAGMLTLVPDEGVGLNWHEPSVATLPVSGPLVYWPAVEFFYPSVPLAGMLSVGTVLLVAVLGGLVGLNAAVLVRRWRVAADASAGADAGTATGVVGLAAPNACCCCGPLLAELGVVALGPSAAVPLYWLFVDVASPVGALFFVASVGFLTANVLRAARAGGAVCRVESGSPTPAAGD